MTKLPSMTNDQLFQCIPAGPRATHTFWPFFHAFIHANNRTVIKCKTDLSLPHIDPLQKAVVGRWAMTFGGRYCCWRWSNLGKALRIWDIWNLEKCFPWQKPPNPWKKNRIAPGKFHLPTIHFQVLASGRVFMKDVSSYWWFWNLAQPIFEDIWRILRLWARVQIFIHFNHVRRISKVSTVDMLAIKQPVMLESG